MVKKRKGEKVQIQDEQSHENLAVNTLINDLEIDESLSYRNIALFPVYRNTLKETKLKTLAEALKEGLVKVEETGVVAEIKITNTSKNTKILIMEGDIVKGGAQDRIINTSVILEEDTTIIVPTSCVQQGRWDNFSAPFTDFKVSSPILNKSLKCSVNKNIKASIDSGIINAGARGLSASYASNQGQVWEQVGTCLFSSSVDSSSSNYTDIYVKKKDNIDEYKKAFKDIFPSKDKSLVGVVVVVGNVCKVDICADNEVFLAHCQALLEGCFVDAISVKNKPKDITVDYIIEVLESIKGIEKKEAPTPNKNGKNLLFESNQINGNALLYKDEIIHLNAFIE